MEQGESGTMKNGVREGGSVFQMEKKKRADGGRARDGGICNEGENWRTGMIKSEGCGSLEVPIGLGLDRCAVELLGLGRGEPPGEAGPL